MPANNIIITPTQLNSNHLCSESKQGLQNAKQRWHTTSLQNKHQPPQRLQSAWLSEFPWPQVKQLQSSVIYISILIPRVTRNLKMLYTYNHLEGRLRTSTSTYNPKTWKFVHRPSPQGDQCWWNKYTWLIQATAIEHRNLGSQSQNSDLEQKLKAAKVIKLSKSKTKIPGRLRSKLGLRNYAKQARNQNTTFLYSTDQAAKNAWIHMYQCFENRTHSGVFDAFCI